MGVRRVAVVAGVVAAVAAALLWLRRETESSAGSAARSATNVERSQRSSAGGAGESPGAARAQRATGDSAATAAGALEEGRTPPLEHPATAADGFAEVRVVSGDQPVPGARVALYWRATTRREATAAFRTAGTGVTGRDGSVRLPARAGAYLVSVHSAPLATAEQEFVRPAGTPVTRVEVKLSQAYVLKGRTLSRGTNDPVAQAHIVVSETLRAAGFRGGRRTEELPPEERPTAQSDSTGRFQVAGLRAGTYSVEATSVGHSRAELRVAVPRDGELSLELPDAAVIEGKVVSANGSAGDGAEVLAMGRGNQTTTVAAQGGGFSLEVDPGTYHLSAHRGAEAGAQGDPVVAAAGQTVRGIVLQLGAAATIAGTVFAQSSGRPIPGATIALAAMGTASVTDMATSDAAGNFSIGGLSPGSYDATVHADGYTDQTRRGVTVARGQTFPLQVGLVGTGSVSGLVTDSAQRPLAGAVVRLAGGFGAGAFGAASPQQEAVAGADGRYRLDNLTPGTVRLAASRDEASFGPAKSVDVVESQIAALDFALADNGILEGHVRLKSAVPPDPSTVVRAMQQGEMGGFRDGAVIGSAPVDATGAYQFALPPGHYRVLAMGANTRRQQPSLATVTANQIAQLDLLLDDMVPGTSGTVVEPSGAPSAGATVLLLSAQRQPLGMAMTDGDGKFTASQFRGAAPATVRARNGGRIGEVPVGDGDAVVQLQSAATLHGTIASGGTPPPSFTVSVTPVDTSSVPWGGGGAGPLEFAGDHFDLYDQPGVDVTVTVKTADGRSGTQAVPLRPGQEANATIALQDSAAITGRVLRTDRQQPVSGAVLLLDGSARPGSGSLTGGDGRFRLTGLAAGSHSLAVRAGQFAAPPQTVALTPGQALDVGDIVLPLPKTPSGTIGVRFFASGTAVAMGSIVPGGPADLAGIQEGDLLVAVDGVPPQSPTDARLRSDGAPGTPVSIALQRGTAKSTVQVLRAP